LADLKKVIHRTRIADLMEELEKLPANLTN